MKRDWDLVREIFLRIEKLEGNEHLDSDAIANYAPESVCYNMKMLADGGYITGHDVSALAQAYWATGLTWEGAELLDEIRDPSLWGKVKAKAKEKGVDLSIDVIKLLAKTLLATYLK